MAHTLHMVHCACCSRDAVREGGTAGRQLYIGWTGRCTWGWRMWSTSAASTTTPTTLSSSPPSPPSSQDRCPPRASPLHRRRLLLVPHRGSYCAISSRLLTWRLVGRDAACALRPGARRASVAPNTAPCVDGRAALSRCSPRRPPEQEAVFRGLCKMACLVCLTCLACSVCSVWSRLICLVCLVSLF